MLMVLGLFVFERAALCRISRCSIRRTTAGRQMTASENHRLISISGRAKTSRTLSGVLYSKITGGRLSLTAIELMADEGRAWPLIDGTGMIHGMYVIDKVTHTHTELFNDGRGKKNRV